MRDRMENEFKKRLENYQDAPEEKLWDKIAGEIALPEQKKNPSWKKVVSISGVLILVGIVSYLIFDYKLSDKNISMVYQKKNNSSTDQGPGSSFNESLTRKIEKSDFVSFKYLLNLKKSTPGNNMRDGDDLKAINEGPDLFTTTNDLAVSTTDKFSLLNETVKEELKEESQINPSTEKQVSSLPLTAAQTSQEKVIQHDKEKKILNLHSLEEKDEKQKDKSSEKEKAKIKAKELKKIDRRWAEMNHHKLIVYINAMPTFGYQRIVSNNNDNTIIQGIKKIPTFSMNRLGVRVELGVEYPVSERLKLFSGLIYYQRKQTIDYTQKVVDSTSVSTNSSGEVVVTPYFSYQNKTFEYELKNAGIQLGFNYQLAKRKFLQTVGTGIEFQIALNKLSSADKNQGFTTNPSAYVFYNLYYRLQYPSEGRFKAVAQPMFNYSFYINENLNAPFYVKPFGLGLNIGCTYSF